MIRVMSMSECLGNSSSKFILFTPYNFKYPALTLLASNYSIVLNIFFSIRIGKFSNNLLATTWMSISLSVWFDNTAPKIKFPLHYQLPSYSLCYKANWKGLISWILKHYLKDWKKRKTVWLKKRKRKKKMECYRKR